MAERKRRDDLEFDDQQVGDNEAPEAVQDDTRRRAAQHLRELGGPDQTDARWVPGYGERGWLTLRDPFTGERHEVPTKYVPTAPWRAVPGGEPAPQWLVRRAMEKLPPKPPRPKRRGPTP